MHTKLFAVCIALMLLLFAVTSCNKNASQPFAGFMGFSDSMATYKALYSGNRITSVETDSVQGLYKNRVLYEYGSNYIKARFEYPNSNQINYNEYFLNSNQLPVKIDMYRNYSGSTMLERSVKFFYNAAQQLDSVSDGIATYLVENSNGNITGITAVRRSVGNDTLKHFFTYSSVPNVFRTTDPYLYIYNDLNFSVPYLIIATTFSSNTLLTFSPSYNNMSATTFRYKTNSGGKLVEEDYGSQNYPFKRVYSY